jgi:hypothetical protein
VAKSEARITRHRASQLARAEQEPLFVSAPPLTITNGSDHNDCGDHEYFNEVNGAEWHVQ